MDTTTIEPATESQEETSHIDGQFTSILSTLSQFKTQIVALSTQLKSLEKVVKKEIKQHKREATKKQTKGNRKPSGFAEAAPISDDLCDFMGKDHGTNMARTEVTREINSYIREHKLQDKDNGRKIIPDKKLTSLLKIKKGEELTYFNLQKYMSPHFAKASDKVATV